MAPFILNLTARHIEWSTSVPLPLPWGENGGVTSVILILGTLPTLCVGERASETHSTWGWSWPKASFDVNWTKIHI